MTLESALRQLEEKALREHYPESTIKNYKSKLRRLSKYFHDAEIEDITLLQIQEFFNVRVKRDKVSFHTIQVDKYALEFFYNHVLNKNYNFDTTNNPATQQKVAREFFTKEEISKLLDAAETLQHKLIFGFMYHFEMDRGEITKLLVKNIENQKDGGVALKSAIRERSEKLPASLSNELRSYLSINKPTKWLFEFTKGKQPMGDSIHRIFTKTLLQAGIHKKLSTKSLSDSHAEHARQFSITLIDEILMGKVNGISDNLTGYNILVEVTDIPDDFYKKLIDEVNSLYVQEFTLSLSVLIRKLLENLLIDILRKRYGTSELGLYYDTSKRRFLDFSVLLKNFENKLSDFGHITGNLDNNLISQINSYRETGNAGAHSIEANIKIDFFEKKQRDLNYLVQFLFRLLKNIPT